MKRSTKKVVAVSLTSAMILSMTSCAFLDKSKDEVLEAADTYAKNMAACSVDKLAKLTVSDFEDDQEEWAGKLDFSEGEIYTADAAEAVSAIADTISYEIDEESAEASKKSGEGSVDVTFTIADYESLLEDDSLASVDDFVAAVGDADTVEISVTLEFEKDDEDWLCSNYGKAFDALYAFTGESYVFTLPVTECLDATNLEWWFTDNGDDTAPVYTNATQISAELPIDESLNYDASLPGVRAELTVNGAVIFTSENSSDLWAHTTDVDAAYLDESGEYFAAGTYTITYYLDDEVILSGSATVNVEATATPTAAPAATGGMADDVGYNAYYTDSSDPFYNGSSVPVWFNSDNGVYASGVAQIEYTIERLDDTLGDVTYEYYYSADGSYDTAELVYTNTVSCNTSYSDGEYYECTYDNPADGYYCIIVYHGGVQQGAGVCSVGM